MTSPKLVTSPPQGSGLVPSIVDKHYDDLVRGVPGEHITAAVILQPVGIKQRRTKDGIHREVTYEVVRLEPMRDQHDADQVTWLVTRAHDLRHDGQQMTLPVSSPAEMRASIETALTEWATGEDIDQDALNAQWTSYFGGPEHAATQEVAKGSLAQLQEFAGHVGAIDDPYATDEPQAVAPPAFSDDGGDDGAEPDDEPDVA